MERSRIDFKILTGKLTGNRFLGKPRDMWPDNIRMDLKEIDINTRNWVASVQDRDYWRAIVYAELKLLGCISDGVSYTYKKKTFRKT